jgi:hypothetical protein
MIYMDSQKLHENILDHSTKAKARMRQIDTLQEAEASGTLSSAEALEMSRDILRQAAAEADESVEAIDALIDTGELRSPEAVSEPADENNHPQMDPARDAAV